MTPETPAGPNGPEIIKDLDAELQEAQEQLAKNNERLVRLLDGHKLIDILRRIWFHDDSNAVAKNKILVEGTVADVIIAICDTVRKSGDANLFNELSGIITAESRAERKSKEEVTPTEKNNPA